jgi:hypothetical protein
MPIAVGEWKTDGPADPRRRTAMSLATCLFYLESEAEKASLVELARTIHDVAVKAAVAASDA